LEGWRCGEIMGEVLGGKGKIGVTTGMLTNPALALRRKGFLNCLTHRYPGIRVVGVFENFWDTDRITQGTLDLLQQHPDLDGMYGTEGIAGASIARAVAGSKWRGQVRVVAHDTNSDTMEAVKAGQITATLSQDPYAQGYEPVVHLYNHLAGGWQPPASRLLSRIEVVTRVNCAQYWDEDKGLIQSAMYLDRLVKPMDAPAGKRLKIAFIGKEDNEFRKVIKSGVLAAAEKLKPMGVTTDWITPNPGGGSGKTDMTVVTFGPLVKSVIRKKYDGFAVPVVDSRLVPYLNEAVEAGIPVITYNSEPFGLRSLVYTITQQADRLLGLSEDLASSAQQVNATTNQINRTMGQIAAGASTQNAQVRETETVLEGLLTGIDKVSREAGESAASAEHTARAVVTGTEAMDKTLGGIRQIEGSVDETWKVVEELGQRSKRIDAVVELINDIASQVNVLALNAAIEATRAGESGKGFMVVANEIRRLARGTAEATGEVTGLVGAVQAGIRGVERSMGEGLERVRESTRLTDEAKEALGRIRELVEANRLRMNKIAGSIVEMQRFSHQVGESMRGVASISEQNTRAVEEVNTATQEMGVQFREVAELARGLESMAQSEQKLLAKFNVASGRA
jgi:methyl-accepting chemotaxis protein